MMPAMRGSQPLTQVADTLSAADPKHLGAGICVLATLHTWGQKGEEKVSGTNGTSLSRKRLQPRNLRDRGWGKTSGTVHSSMRPVPLIKGVRFDHNLCSCYH